MLRRRVRFTIFPKLVVGFLLMVAPLFGLGLVMNKQGETSVSEELSNSLASRVQFYSKTLDNEKDHILMVQRQYAGDPDLRQLSFIGGIMTPFVWSDTVLGIQNKLQLIKSSSVYIENVSAHMLTINRTISSNRSLSDTVADDYEAVRNARSQDHSALIYWQDRLFLGLPYPDPPLPDRESAYVLSIELSAAKFRETLQQITDYEGADAVLFNPQQDWMLAGSDAAEEEPTLRRVLKAKFEERGLEGVEQVRIGSEAFLFAYRYLPEFGSYVCAYVPKAQVFGKLDRNRNTFWVLSILSLLIILVYSYWIFRLIHRPLNALVRSFRRVEGGQMETIALPRGGRDEFYNLFNHFNAMVAKLNVLIHQVYEQKIRAQSSELKQLQSQINPHFLYNTYFILYRLAKIEDLEGVTRFSQVLGQYFQFITRSASDEVPLRDEVGHTRTYVEIQNIRFSNRIQVEFEELPAASETVMVPRLILQPILENAYKYGLESKLEDGCIAIRFRQEEGCIRIAVEDNGEELTDERLEELRRQLAEHSPERESTGLLNVHRRLQLMYGDRSGLAVSRGGWGGMHILLTIGVDVA